VTDQSSDVQADAVERAQDVFAALELLDMTAFGRISLSLRAAEMRAATREAAARAAEAAGLGPMLDEARRAARDFVTNAFDNAPFRGIGIDLAESRSRPSVDDRVAAMLAVEDAVIAAVADPFLTDDDRSTLASPFETLRPSWDEGEPLPQALAERHVTVTRWSQYAVFVVLVIGSVVLLALGSGVGLFGLAAAIGIGLVALVVRGRSSG
jgi:hypothetical protein